jgi:hypothetical protein
MTDLAAELIDDAARLAAVAGAWQALWQRVPTATPFQLPAWLLSWWRSFHPGALAVVAVWKDERLVGLAPFYIERGRSRDRVLSLGIGVSDYLDLLIDPESAISFDCFLDPLRRLPGWRACQLDELAASDVLQNRTESDEFDRRRPCRRRQSAASRDVAPRQGA